MGNGVNVGVNVETLVEVAEGRRGDVAVWVDAGVSVVATFSLGNGVAGDVNVASEGIASVAFTVKLASAIIELFSKLFGCETVQPINSAKRKLIPIIRPKVCLKLTCFIKITLVVLPY